SDAHPIATPNISFRTSSMTWRSSQTAASRRTIRRSCSSRCLDIPVRVAAVRCADATLAGLLFEVYSVPDRRRAAIQDPDDVVGRRHRAPQLAQPNRVLRAVVLAVHHGL